ncbi:uncharacterized protein OGAPODRAFT_15266 [Ogataea polymorpha]|uniref:uncharacterized protein n=1 Tax=Ogataea polymorpha TaxID=460523 RepID=UPI0007F3944D|nr:uncharacterized protein OGAPODRAFT_15266 [Ogataea polymorpha]OBA18535.1 hypothetical protein OGAPODRAFT_15266 [Ogataea polymorpha]
MLLTSLNRLLTLLLLAGATLLLLFIVFSGSVSSFPFNQFYWVQARTSNLNPSGDISRWTFWGICNPETYDSHSNGNCTNLGPDQPISPYDNFGNSTSLPQDFVTNRDTYYYLSRFSFPFILIALVFAGVSFICTLFQLCWTTMKQVVIFFVSLSVLFCAAGVSCQTAVSVMVRNKFSDAGMSAKVGPSMLGMAWAALVCLLIVFFLTCCSGMHRAYKIHREQRQLEMGQTGPAGAPVSQPVSGPLAVDETNQGTLPSNEGGIRFFKIKRTQKAIDEESL